MALIPDTHLKVLPLKSLLRGSWLCCHQALAASEKDQAALDKQVSQRDMGLTGHGYIRHCKAKHVSGSRSAVQSRCCWEPNSPVIHIFRVSFWAGFSMVLRTAARVQLRMGRSLLEHVFQLRATQTGISTSALIALHERIKAQQARRFAERPHSQFILIHKYSMRIIGVV